MPHPGFLELPARTQKLRRTGLTHVIDRGLPLEDVRGWLSLSGPSIDVWKFGWGTSYLDPELERKVALLGEHDVRACVGGTLLEIAWAQDRVDECLRWASAVGFPLVEVSNGAVAMPLDEKRRLIARAAADFSVLAEVGSKDPRAGVSAAQWAEEAAGDLDAGALWVLAEGRESGTVGLYEPDGSVREDVVAALIGAGGREGVIFEAPAKDQQAWLIGAHGPNVNLGNVRPGDALGLETLRLGLRADTIGLSTPGRALDAPGR